MIYGEEVPLKNQKKHSVMELVPENDALSRSKQNQYPVLEFLPTKLCSALQIG